MGKSEQALLNTTKLFSGVADVVDTPPSVREGFSFPTSSVLVEIVFPILPIFDGC